MQPALFVPTKYESRYGLLGTFCAEVIEAARALGVVVNPDAQETRQRVAGGEWLPVFVMFNMPGGTAELGAWMNGVGGGGVLVQWMVDHPFHADAKLLDMFAKQGAYRFACVADDDLHLLQLRWPGVKRMRLWHGVPRGALCAEVRGSRDVDVLLAGSLPEPAETERLRTCVPEVLRDCSERLVELRERSPAMSFGQAFDICAPAGLHCDDLWSLMTVMFRYTTAELNRRRRVSTLRALHGLRVTVLGNDAWREHMSAEMTLVGQVAYAELRAWAARSKVWVAVNPAQFAGAFSERLLIGLAGGAACVSDDRAWVNSAFSGVCATYGGNDMDGLRRRVDGLLGNENERHTLGVSGRRLVEERHLWEHRVQMLLEMLGFGERRS